MSDENSVLPVYHVVHAGWELQDYAWSYPTSLHRSQETDIEYDLTKRRYMRSMPFHWLILIIEGSLEISAFGQQLSASQGACVHIEPHVPHHIHISQAAKYIWVHFRAYDLDFNRQSWKPGSPGIPNIVVPANSIALRKHFLAILEELTVQQEQYQTLANGHLSLLLAHLARDGAAMKHTRHSWQVTDEAVIQAMEYMNQHYAGKLSISELARHTNLSPNYFTTRFGQVTGMSPRKYLTLIRIGHARQLLRSTTIPMTAVAERSGFDSFPHFSRIFKQYEGVSPREYRTKH
ncbi:AraC family transcriptional regulator [Paenibacillus nasutitermitis]|uniref:HTH araC/xylS-type domain-containing protein n=1 Tax=Paenibacillus nasutitermitis TaxID=1652958 RepID=A0A916Z662_9BACL|nr:helix-turn-helix domain-containing protein [Paenibacillus nasutitermitis]GGD78304.1 hypothetical protein GCM10010911_40420 [Paenibacillus nasutitermitis]